MSAMTGTRLPDGPQITLRDVRRPVVVALAFTVAGEALIFLIWGLALFPSGRVLEKAIWTGTCAVAMGAVIGAAVNFFVTGEMRGRAAAVAAGTLFLTILTTCTFLCFWIDHRAGLFGAQTHPFEFVLGGLVPALLAAPVYGWLIGSEKGQTWSDGLLGRAM